MDDKSILQRAWERLLTQLGAPDRHPEILARQAEHLRRHVVTAPVSSLLLLVLVMGLVHDRVDTGRLWLWAAVLTATLALRLSLRWIRPRSPDGLRRWIFAFQWSTTATGVAWVWLLLVMPREDLALQILSLLTACGVVMAVLPLLAVVEHAYSSYVVFALAPLVAMLLSWGDRFHLVLGVMIAAFLLNMLRSERLVNRTFTTALRQGLHEAERAARDPVTGIANRRCFQEALEQEWRRSQRTARPLSMLMIDIDEFKAYNDNYGHVQGDQCLAQVARTLARHVPRSTDLVARYGGEEFAVLLPETDVQGAKSVAQRLLEAVRELGIVHTHSAVSPRITISIGGATCLPTKLDTPTELIDAADQALYTAKQAGKDRVEWTEGATHDRPAVRAAS